MDGDTPVYDEVCEKALVGSAIAYQETLQAVADLVDADDFYLEANRTIWSAVVAIHKSGGDVDSASVASELQRADQFQRVGGAAYLSDLLDVMPFGSHIEEQARRIRWASKRRTVEMLSSRLRALARDPGSNDAIIESTMESIRRSWEDGTIGIPTLTIAELMRKAWPLSRRWLVEGWWRSSAVGLLVGEQKSSKSVFALCLALSIASGMPLFRRWKTTAGKVLIVDEEDTEQSIQGRARRLGAELSLPTDHDNLVIAAQTGVRIDTARGRGALGALLRRVRPTLLILDPFRQVAPTVDENDSRQVSEPLAWLRSQQRELGMSIMVLHHMRKESREKRKQGEQAKRIEDRIRGSSAFAGWYDSTIFMARQTEDEHRLVAKHRDGGRVPRTGDVKLWIRWEDERDGVYVGFDDSKRGQQGSLAQPADDDPPDEEGSPLG